MCHCEVDTGPLKRSELVYTHLMSLALLAHMAHLYDLHAASFDFSCSSKTSSSGATQRTVRHLLFSRYAQRVLRNHLADSDLRLPPWLFSQHGQHSVLACKILLHASFSHSQVYARRRRRDMTVCACV